MVYVPRIEIPYGYYHVGTRGNNKRSIYVDDRDRELFMFALRRIARKFGWLFYAYCLMGNHYHLVVQIGEAGISRGMCELNTWYAINYNARHNRTNHLFGRRFWSELITSDAHLLGACRYVVQNPVRARLCKACEDWQWSSYRGTIGVALPEPFLAVRDVLDFVAPGGRNQVDRFREYCGTIVPSRLARSSHGRWQPP
jgi:REP element-mobilizing transposase RayT